MRTGTIAIAGLAFSLLGLGQIDAIKELSPLSLLIISLGGIASIVALYKQQQAYIQQAKDNQTAMIQQGEYSQKLLADSLANQEQRLINYKLESDKGVHTAFNSALTTVSDVNKQLLEIDRVHHARDNGTK